MSTQPDIVDTRGLRCPMPVIKAEAALRKRPNGGQILVFADDPIAAIDIPHFCAEAGHLVERQPDREGVCVFLITRRTKTETNQ